MLILAAHSFPAARVVTAVITLARIGAAVFAVAQGGTSICVERIGDYAKNLSEIVDIRPAALAEDQITLELQEIRQGVEDASEALSGVFERTDRERAVELIRQRRDAAHRCDALIERIALSDYDASTATALALGTRYYKRIGGHVLNVVSSVVMPIPYCPTIRSRR